MTRPENLIRRILRLPPGSYILKDAHLRLRASLYLGFFMNLFFITLKLVSGIRYRSVWFICLAGYYTLLAVAQFLLFRRGSKPVDMRATPAAWHRYRACGGLLAAITPVLAVIVAFMVLQNRSYDYPGFLIYAMAIYTFWAVPWAIRNLVKFRKADSPILSASGAVGLVAAMVSLLALETALLTRFGDGDSLFRHVMILVTGVTVCLVVLAAAVRMLIRSTRALRTADTAAR